MPPNELQKVIVTEIEGYVDEEAWEATKEEINQGKLEIKEKLKKIIRSFSED